MGFFSGETEAPAPVTGRTRDYLEREKALTLRSIKELEFDHAMRKVGDKDFEEMSSRLRARAVELMDALEQPNWEPPKPRQQEPNRCPACDALTDADARFCKQCGAKL
jgi:hypothetical protein